MYVKDLIFTCTTTTIRVSSISLGKEISTFKRSAKADGWTQLMNQMFDQTNGSESSRLEEAASLYHIKIKLAKNLIASCHA